VIAQELQDARLQKVGVRPDLGEQCVAVGVIHPFAGRVAQDAIRHRMQREQLGEMFPAPHILIAGEVMDPMTRRLEDGPPFVHFEGDAVGAAEPVLDERDAGHGRNVGRDPRAPREPRPCGECAISPGAVQPQKLDAWVGGSTDRD